MESDLINNPTDLRGHYGDVSALARDKVLDRLDSHCRRFISLSPFAVLATTSKTGDVDASPRGDAPGFVQCENDQFILLPDRPGNNRVDSLSNVIDNPGIGLIFFVPGVNETLRINGDAEISTDAELLSRFAVRDRLPLAVVRIQIKEAFLHCAKALVRSKLWQDDYRVERKTLPSLGAILADQIDGVVEENAEEIVQDSLKNTLY